VELLLLSSLLALLNSAIFKLTKETMTDNKGTATHTHTLTDFVVLNGSHPDNNSTLYDGTSTLSLQADPATDIPIPIQKTNDKVIIININPESVDNHFGSYLFTLFDLIPNLCIIHPCQIQSSELGIEFSIRILAPLLSYFGFLNK
jgi:hypothetical protein